MLIWAIDFMFKMHDSLSLLDMLIVFSRKNVRFLAHCQSIPMLWTVTGCQARSCLFGFASLVDWKGQIHLFLSFMINCVSCNRTYFEYDSWPDLYWSLSGVPWPMFAHYFRIIDQLGQAIKSLQILVYYSNSNLTPRCKMFLLQRGRGPNSKCMKCAILIRNFFFVF